MPEDLISFNEAATLIGKNLRTIQRYIKNGRLNRYQKDDKNFISRQELENKFTIMATRTAKSVATQKEEDATSSSATGDFQKKWIDEVEKHAQTREELGIWKGRAEAYQTFASRLLSSGEKIDLEQNPSPEIKKDEPIANNDRSPQMTNSLIYYIAFAVLFVILILLFVLIRIYTS